jgi:hypothetical protein
MRAIYLLRLLLCVLLLRLWLLIIHLLMLQLLLSLRNIMFGETSPGSSASAVKTAG